MHYIRFIIFHSKKQKPIDYKNKTTFLVYILFLAIGSIFSRIQNFKGCLNKTKIMIYASDRIWRLMKNDYGS